MKTKLLTIASLLPVAVDFAQTFTVDGLNYNIMSTNLNEVEITVGTRAFTDLVISETVNNDAKGFIVTSIAKIC